MRYLHIRLTGSEVDLHPLVPTLTDGDVFDRARMVDWAPSLDPPRSTVLLYLEGDLSTFERTLEATEIVLEYDLTHFDDRRGYAYVHSEPHPTEWLLFDAITRGGLIPLCPIEYFPDGSLTLRVVGSHERLQRMVADIPDGVTTTIERVGEYDLGRPPIPDGLPPRQREALDVAFELGYYDVPRTASRADVAAKMDCAPSTASEHLQKAEARLVATFLNRPR